MLVILIEFLGYVVKEEALYSQDSFELRKAGMSVKVYATWDKEVVGGNREGLWDM